VDVPLDTQPDPVVLEPAPEDGERPDPPSSPFVLAPPAPLFTISVGTLAWAAVIALFAGLRIGPTWQAPVVGAELIHLSGAWQASIGVDDDRFIATLFQAITALLLGVSDSEVGPRVLATLATLTIPVALYRLRPVLTDAGALLALILLAVDAPGIVLGTSATAMGFDLAIATWGFVLIAGRLPRNAATCATAGFLGVTAGAIVLPFALALALQMAYRRQVAAPRLAANVAAGAFAGLLVSLVRYGTGIAASPLPGLQLFIDSFDQPWSTASGGEVLAIFALAQVAGGVAAATWWLRRPAAERPSPAIGFALLWAAAAGAWALASLNADTPAAGAALTLPLALASGPALAAALNAMWRADWSVARFMIPAGAVTLLIAGNWVIDWARFEEMGDTGSRIVVTGMLVSTAVALAPLAYFRPMRATLVAPALVLAAIPVLSGAFDAGLSANPDPLLSPRLAAQAGNLRTDMLREAAERGGQIVIHPSLEREITWAFRDSGALVIAAPPPLETAVLIWPANLPQPEGFLPLEGQWALTEAVHTPSDTLLDYLHWLIDRNSLAVTPERIAIYVRASE